MTGQEEKTSNDVFFTCSLIEYISRTTMNHRCYVAEKLGITNIQKILDLADVYHSDNINRVSCTFINECGIEHGNFDNISMCEYSIPTHWDIGKVYKRLALGLSRERQLSLSESILLAFTSFSSTMIEDFNSSFYYDNPAYILGCAIEGRLLD